MYQAGISIPYSEEYKIQPPNKGLLQAISTRTGGQVIKTSEQAMRDIDFESSESKSIQLWVVLIAMLLFFVDITLRRFGWGMLSRLPEGLKREKQEPLAPQQDTNVTQLLKGKKKQEYKKR